MSEPIDIDKVRSILIGTAWHDVTNQTFSIGQQYFECEGDSITDPVLGFSFRSSDSHETIYGPLDSIRALVVDG